MHTHHPTMPVLVFCLCALFPTNGTAELLITKVEADGREMPISSSANRAKSGQDTTLKLSSPPQTARFHFQNDRRPAQKPFRLRYKLEGHDTSWRDTPANMVIWFRLLNKSGHAVAGDTVTLAGNSPGWNGQPENAPLAPLRIAVTAPPMAERFRIYFISNGNKPVIGQMIAADVNVSLSRPNGLTVKPLSVNCTAGEQMDRPHGIPANWKRGGERPELAQVLRRLAPADATALLLNDDDPDKYGVWESLDIPAPLKPGDRLTMDCNIAYSIGSGETKGFAQYEKLKPGTYRFRVAVAQVNGLPTGDEESIQFTVMPPPYQRAEFWLVIIAVCFTVILLATRLVLRRRLRKELEQAERRRLLEEERTRIAKDIHDDLGATLAQIAMLSEIARTDSGTNPADSRQSFNDIFTLAYESTSKLNEIIWAINPANDTLEHVVRYLCHFAENHLKLAGLRFRLEAPETMPPYILASAQRHNIFLAAKEALHNAVKHSSATEINLRIHIKNSVLHISIEDNGKGFTAAQPLPAGHGCSNMKHRMEQINGTCQFTSTHGQGTVVELTLTMQQGHSTECNTPFHTDGENQP